MAEFRLIREGFMVALRDAGYTVDNWPAAQKAITAFLMNKGYPPETVDREGGWLFVVMCMVPKEYPAIVDLVQAIKAAG